MVNTKTSENDGNLPFQSFILLSFFRWIVLFECPSDMFGKTSHRIQVQASDGVYTTLQQRKPPP